MPPRTPQEPQGQQESEDLIGQEAPKASAADPDLIKRIAELEAQLEASKSAEQKTAELMARTKAAAQSQALFGPANTEVQTGEDEDGNPLYAYRIDLPASGGEFIRINGQALYHGSTYTFDIDMLRTIKEIVARSWAHEKTIMGDNENAYRKPKEIRL